MKTHFFSLLLLCCAISATAQTSVTTYHYDNARTGQNIQETILTPANVGGTSFGKLFSQTLDGTLYAQPLYVPNLPIVGKGTHNVLFVATEGDSVYAFDADSATGGNASPLWHASLIDAAHGAAPGATTIPNTDFGGCLYAVGPQYGVTSTPVIDLRTDTLYVEARSKENGKYIHRLHALDITTGLERIQGPVTITATAGSLAFDPFTHLNRPGLLLSGNTVYLGFASNACDFDNGPFQGWVMSYDTVSLKQTAAFNVAPTGGGGGGIWMGGGGLAGDANGNVFFSTGNGNYDGLANFSESVLKLSPSLSVADFFTPSNESPLSNEDFDIASGGVLLLPDQSGAHPHLLVALGKEGKIYLIDRDQMTSGNIHYCPSCTSDPIVQELPGAVGGPTAPFGYFFGSSAYWNNNVYFWGVGDVLKAFSLSSGLLNPTPLMSSDPVSNYPGQALSVSSNGNANGIVWSLKTDKYYNAPSGAVGPETLYAHDATTLASIYSSDTNFTRDDPGGAAKFTIPVVMNGKVYVGAAEQTSVYGIIGGPAPGPPYYWSDPAGPSCNAPATGELDCFAIGTDTAMYHKQWSGSWQPWEALSGGFTSEPSCIFQGTNITCTAAGGDGQLYSNTKIGTWQGWVGMGAHIISNPNCVSWQTERIDCMARNSDGIIYQNVGIGMPPAWSGWISMGGGGFASEPSCVVNHGTPQIDCFARGPAPSFAMYHTVWTTSSGGTWSGWASLGGGFVSAPSCVSWGPGRIDCFGVGTTMAMYHKASNSGVWDISWQNLGGGFTSKPSCVTWGKNRLDCTGRGTDFAMYRESWNGSTWSGWNPLTGGLTTTWISAPSCATWGINRLDCVAIGPDSKMYHNAWTGSAWQGWESTAAAGDPALQLLSGQLESR